MIPPMNPFVASLFAFLVLASQGSFAAELFGQSRTKTKAQLVLERDMIRPGGTVTAAVVLTMPPGWHTYWQHPGESGGATEIAWELPPGITAGNIQWPTPEKYVDSDITTYIYHDEAALLVELRAEDAIAPAQHPEGQGQLARVRESVRDGEWPDLREARDRGRRRRGQARIAI